MCIMHSGTFVIRLLYIYCHVFVKVMSYYFASFMLILFLKNVLSFIEVGFLHV